MAAIVWCNPWVKLTMICTDPWKRQLIRAIWEGMARHCIVSPPVKHDSLGVEGGTTCHRPSARKCLQSLHIKRYEALATTKQAMGRTMQFLLASNPRNLSALPDLNLTLRYEAGVKAFHVAWVQLCCICGSHVPWKCYCTSCDGLSKSVLQ